MQDTVAIVGGGAWVEARKLLPHWIWFKPMPPPMKGVTGELSSKSYRPFTITELSQAVPAQGAVPLKVLTQETRPLYSASVRRPKNHL